MNDKLKAQPTGVVLPKYKAEPNPVWATEPHVGRPLNAEEITEARAYNSALNEVARLNQPASAGDERAAFELFARERYPSVYFGKSADSNYIAADAQWLYDCWQASAALSANHSEQVRDVRPLRHHANKIFNKVNAAAEQYEKGQSALGLMEDIAESALIVRNGLDAMIAAAPSAGS